MCAWACTLYSMLPSMSTSGGNEPWWFTHGESSMGVEGNWKAAMLCGGVSECGSDEWNERSVMRCDVCYSQLSQG